MNVLITLAAFIFALSVLVAFHEFGHYLIARLCNVKVLRFSLGFGKPVYVRRAGKDQTEWAVGKFPLGGYVKMLDEREGEVPEAELSRAFNRQSVGKRIAIVAAGPIANFLLAILLYCGLFMTGVPGLKPYVAEPLARTLAAEAGLKEGDLIRKVEGSSVASWQDLHWILIEHAAERHAVNMEIEDARGRIVFRNFDLSSLQAADLEKDLFEKIGLQLYEPKLPPVIGEVLAGSAAADSGLKAGDEILSIDSKSIVSPQAVIDIVRANPNKLLPFEISRSGKIVKIEVLLKAESEKSKPVGRLGAVIRMNPLALEKLRTTVRYPIGGALSEATGKTWQTTIFSLKMMGKMIIGELSWKNLSGPVAIADIAGKSVKQGAMPYIEFLALISISLGVLNLLPIPLLDGGHLMYYMAEMFKGSPVSEYAMELGSRIGFVLLLGLMAFAFYNDINRLLTS